MGTKSKESTAEPKMEVIEESQFIDQELLGRKPNPQKIGDGMLAEALSTGGGFDEPETDQEEGEEEQESPFSEEEISPGMEEEDSEEDEEDTEGEDELERLRAENARLQDELNASAFSDFDEYLQKVLSGNTQLPQTETSEEGEEEGEAFDFSSLTEDDFDRVVSDRNAFVGFLSKLSEKVRQDTIAQVSKEEEVKSYKRIQNFLAAKEAMDSFFSRDENADLQPVQSIVHKVAAAYEQRALEAGKSMTPVEALRLGAKYVRQQMKKDGKKGATTQRRKQHVGGTSGRTSSSRGAKTKGQAIFADLKAMKQAE